MPPRPTRRQMMFGAAGAVLGAAGVAGVAATTGDGATGARSAAAPPPGADPAPARRSLSSRDAVATTEWVRSEARGRSVRLVTVLPRDADRAELPVCVGLHGLRGNAAWWGERGTRRLLGRAWAAGVNPYALVAVDGGDNYWHPYTASDDPLGMLVSELPVWLRARGLGGGDAGLPALAMGVSMGGTGALIYARERVRLGLPLRAVAALSPGLFLDWSSASRRPFRSEASWAAYDPMRFWPQLAATPIGVWCGDRDWFVDATRRFIATAAPAVGRVSPGRHDGAYYARVLPEVYGFLGRHLRPGELDDSVPPLSVPPRPIG